MRVAFLGLGAIGEPMAARLAATESLIVWNRTPARAAEFAARYRAAVAKSPREAAAGAEALITCLPTSREVEAVLDGPDGVLAGAAPGLLILDCTSGDPAASRRIATRLATRRIGFADAPVSGGVSGARAGTLTIMVGGDPAAFQRALPILRLMGQRVEHVGPVGAGHALKAVNNTLLAVNLLAAGEGLAALVKAGVPASAAIAVLNASSGRSFVTEVLIPERVLSGAYPQTFRLALLDKDVGIARDFVDGTGVEAPLISLVAQLMSRARALLGERADHVEVIRLIEQQAAVEIRSETPG
jgi:3-hydroxyisobutyrate dehydrogenase